MEKKNRKYRFFYHYNKWNGGLTVHFRGQCHPCKNIVCYPTTASKWNKIQPNLVMQGFTIGLDKNIDTNTITIL